MHKTSSPLLGLRLLAFAAVLAGSGLAIADSQAIRYYEDAITRFNAGDVKGAQIQLKNSLQHDPGQLSARILMGRIQLELGNPQQAEEQLLLADKLGADTILTALPLARARNRLGKYQDNIETIVPTRIPIRQQPDLWVELGIARLNSDDVAGAQLAFDQALKIQPGHPGGTLGLARIPLHQGDYVAAEQLAEAAVANAPDDAEAWFIKGSALHAQGKYIAAAKAYGQAKQIDPGNSSAALGEATALLDAGHATEAVVRFQALRESHPWIPEAPYLQSKAFRLLGRDKDAETALQAAADILNPIPPDSLAHDPALLMLAGMIAYESGQLERAYQMISLYLEKRSDDSKARKLLARTALRMQKPSYARRALLPLVAGGQADAETLALLGDANLQQNSYAAAERNYREAIAKHSGGPALISRLGITQFRQGQRERAMETLQRLVDKAPAETTSGVSLYLGMLYFSEGRLTQAREIADTLVREQPDNLLALNLQATLAIAMGDRAAGRRMLEALVDRAPAFRPARFNLVKLHILEGRYRDAGSILDRFLAEDPGDTRALREAAHLALAQKDRRTAIQYYERIRQLDGKARSAIVELVDLYLAAQRPADAMNVALALNRDLPEDLPAQLALARVHMARGETDEARHILTDAALLAGYDPRSLLRTAKLQVAVEAYEDAIRTLSRLLTERPESLAARKELAGVLYRQGKTDRAETEIKRVLEAAPEDLYALALLGDIRMRQGRAREAIEIYGQALSLAELPELVISRYRARTIAGEGQAALAELRHWHDDHPDEPLVLRALAERLHQNGELKSAWPLYERLVELVPNDPMAYNNLANLLMNFDSERALEAARRAHELAPTNPDALDTLGWALVQVGAVETGLKHLRDAVARNGRSAATRYHLGVALEEFGSPTEAERELSRALALAPEFDAAEDARRRLERLRAIPLSDARPKNQRDPRITTSADPPR